MTAFFVFKIILIGFLTIFITINLMAIFLALGYVMEEKHPNHRGLIDKIDDFWKKFWRKIL